MRNTVSIFKRALGIAASALFIGLGLASPAQATTQEAKTKYPIVLLHGFMGFDQLVGIDYWYRIPSDLRRNGATVYVAEVSQLNNNVVRGEQLLQLLKQWSARDGVKKFNIIAHSQGGPTARYTAGVAPSLVASVTTMGSPHTITPTNTPSNAVGDLITNYPAVTQALAKLIATLSGRPGLPQDISAFTGNFVEEIAAFNAQFPDGLPTTFCGQGPGLVNGVAYYSASGSQPKTFGLDPSDLFMRVADIDSDGVVARCSTHWGTVLRDNYPWNHVDEINHVFGLLGRGAPDPVAFYRQHANRLKLQGL